MNTNISNGDGIISKDMEEASQDRIETLNTSQSLYTDKYTAQQALTDLSENVTNDNPSPNGFTISNKDNLKEFSEGLENNNTQEFTPDITTTIIQNAKYDTQEQ
ncbi:hypothetical protein, partial [Salmonella sp. s51228]|uniref:hypothetical protein n=1 Tax=Salmonella sp. s51228 TaxID=3159652 RepID=UPI0039815B34